MMRVFFLFFIAATMLLALYVCLDMLIRATRRMARAFLKFRGTMAVVCPETHEHVAVEVDARHAAVTAVAGAPELVLTNCTRWPERAGCHQDCVRQIEHAPGECLVRTMLAEWYAGKSCAFCGRAFDVIHWADHKPALLTPDRRIVEWAEVAPEKVPDALATHRPVCWNCSVAETFRTEHPELVTDRNSKVAARL
jgi:hypothetical protein